MSKDNSPTARIKQILAQCKQTLGPFVERLWQYLQTLYQRAKTWLVANWPGIRAKLWQYILLTRMDKPIGTLLLMWPALWALWIAAEGKPSLHLVMVFVLGPFLTRSAGCVMNDYADRNFDGHVRRTKLRPLATGKVSAKEALALACGLLVIAFLLVLSTNRLTVLLAFVAIPLGIIYPFMKRHTYLPQFFLGIAFSWSIPMAFAAQTGSVPTIAALLFIANLLWIVVFDTIYAMVDRENDLEIGIKSTAILFDDADRLIIGIMQVMALIVFFIVGSQLELSLPYNVSLVVAAGFSVYQQYLIKDRAPDKCFQAFLNNNCFGASIFTGTVLAYLF